MHDFTWPDKDWIGLRIFKNFADQDWIGFNFIGSGLDSDWKISQSANLWWPAKQVCSIVYHDIKITELVWYPL